MTWQTTPYTLPLLVTGACLVGLAGYVRRAGDGAGSRGTVLGALLMLAGAEWVVAYALTLSRTTMAGKEFTVPLEFAGLAALPLLWFAYVLCYTGREELIDRRLFGPLVAVVAVFVALAFTNDFHHLVYREFRLFTVDPLVGGSFVVARPVYGPVFGVFLTYAFSLILLSAGLLVGALVRSRGVFRRQIATLLIISVSSTVAGASYVAGYTPLPGLDTGALSIAIAAAGIGLSAVRFRWLDVEPVPRDRVLGAVDGAVLAVDGDERVVDVNDSARRLLDSDPDDLVGAPVAEVLPELSALLDGTPPVEGEIAVEVGSTERTFEVDVTEIDGTPGGVEGRAVLLHDVTERERANDRLREQTDAIERLHEATRDLIGARSADEVYGVAADRATELLDVERCCVASVQGDRFRQETSTVDGVLDDRPVAGSHAGVALRSDGIAVVDDLADTRSAAAGPSSGSRRPDGPEKPEEPRVDGETGTSEEPRVDGADGRPVRSLLTAPVGNRAVIQVAAPEPEAFDGTDERVMELLAAHVETALERVAAEADLRRERDRLDRFVSVVSHDLRNPLNVAQGRVEIADREYDDDNLAVAYDALVRMEEMIADLLELAREGEVIGETAPVAVDTVATRAWRGVETPRAALTVDDGLPTMEADEDRLRELFENLFRNAVDHAGPAVSVTVGPLADGFFVADDGPGIDPAVADSVFEAGYTSERGGTGFGLAIVARIAEAHGLSASVTESAAGGARFEFRREEPPDGG